MRYLIVLVAIWGLPRFVSDPEPMHYVDPLDFKLPQFPWYTNDWPFDGPDPTLQNREIWPVGHWGQYSHGMRVKGWGRLTGITKPGYEWEPCFPNDPLAVVGFWCYIDAVKPWGTISRFEPSEDK